MLGRTHTLSGAAFFNALTLIPGLDLAPNLTQRVACTVLAAGAATLCDLDTCGSTPARDFGDASRLVAKAIHRLSGGHREGTHSAVGIAVFTGWTAAAMWGVTAAPDKWVRYTAMGALAAILVFIFASMLESLHLAGKHTADVAALAGAVYMVTHPHTQLFASIPLAVAAGVVAHILGDMLTIHGCPLAWPWSERCLHLLPRFARFRTGHIAEHVIAGALIGVNAWFAWSLTGLATLR